MSYRSARGTLALGLLMSAAFPLGAGAQPMTTGNMAQPADAVRATVDLSKGWRFRFGGDATGVTQPGYDDAGWDRVDVPHTWNHLGAYSLTRPADTDVRQGIGWYRLAFTAPVNTGGKRQILQFDGVGTIAEVWVNGVRVGDHKGAFSRFRFDVTDQLKPGTANMIVVKADNSAPAPGSSTENIIPLGGDFFVHGGIYRGVSLIGVDSAHIDVMDHGGPGVYLRTPSVSSARAEVNLRARLKNSGAKARALTVRTSISDADGRAVVTDNAPARLAGNGAIEIERALVIDTPHLWQGRDDPYLYSVTVELRDGARVIDRVVQPLGIRSFLFDPDKGFILNGKPTRLHGASRHQDMAGKGWALTPQDHARDMAIMAEMGVNTVRHAHYQHAQEWSDEADKAGMVVWAELPFVHQSSLVDGPPTQALVDNAKEQLVELIRQNYNHPSIMIWSVGNEIDIGAAIAALQKGADGPPAQSRAMLQTLDALARQEDASRPTAYADCCEDTRSPVSLKGAEVLSDVTQMAAFNRYFGWYYGEPATVGRALDGMHAKYPRQPIALSEYGAGGSLSQHSDNPLGGPVNSRGRPHPEEYQSWVHEETWKVLKSRDYLAATWIWNMFDFASTSREEGDAIDINNKGMVTYDRTIRKDIFYFYKANWSKEPVLYLTGRHYADRAYSVLDVRAYSNADRAQLSVNGQAAGEAACPDHICVWPGVRLQTGANTVTVTASINGKALSDSVDWTVPDAAKGLFIDAGALTGLTTANGVRYGSDNFFTGGTGKALSLNGIDRRPGAKAPEVTGTTEPALYANYREGKFGYTLPLPDGRWTVTVHMVEPDDSKAASRSFSITANGKAVLTDFNPAKAAGGARKAVMRTFPVSVRGGQLSLQFEPGGGDAVVAAIAVAPR